MNHAPSLQQKLHQNPHVHISDGFQVVNDSKQKFIYRQDHQC